MGVADITISWRIWMILGIERDITRQMPLNSPGHDSPAAQILTCYEIHSDFEFNSSPISYFILHKAVSGTYLIKK